MNIDDISVPNVQTNVLGNVLNLRIRKGIFQQPDFRFIRSKYDRYGNKEIVEIYVLFDKPVPMRSASPALFVGDEKITEGAYVSDSEIKFFVFQHDKLKEGSAIQVGWSDGPPESRINTNFKYELEYKEKDDYGDDDSIASTNNPSKIK